MDENNKTGDPVKGYLFNTFNAVPLKLVNAASIVMLLVLLWIVYSLYQSNNAFISYEKKIVKLEEIYGNILLYDEILTMSARTAVLTGDISWEQRYRDTKKKLDESILKASTLFPEVFHTYFEKAKTISQRLVEYENKAFELIRLGNVEQARSSLSNGEYQKSKEQYAEVIANLYAALQTFMQQEEQRSETRNKYYLFEFFLILIIFVFAWISLNRALKSERLHRNRTQEFVEKTDVFLAGVLESVEDGIVSINKEGVIISVNPAMEKLFGYSSDEMLGQNVKILMPSPYQDEHDDYIRRYLETGENKIIGIGRQVSGRRKDGSTFPMKLVVRENIIGDKLSFIGVIRDITEWIDNVKQREEQKFFYENLFRELDVPAFLLDNDHKILMWNKASERMTGALESDLLGTSKYHDVIYKEERPILADLVLDGDFDDPDLYPVAIEDDLATEGKKVQNWVDFPLTDKPPLYLAIDAAPVYDANGERVAVLQIMQDITTMKQQEESIKESHEKLQEINQELILAEKNISIQKEYYESLIQDLGVPVFVINKEHKVITWNQACEELSGIKAEEIIGTDGHWKGFYPKKRRLFADFILDEDFSEIDANYATTYLKSQMFKDTFYVENWNLMRNGDRHYTRGVCNIIRDERDEMVAVAEVLLDMTELKESHIALEQQQEELKRSNSELERFAYVASHDLQEPLRMVSSYTQLLEKRYEGQLDQDAKDYIAFAVDGATRMQALIKDLLRYSRLNTEAHEFAEVDVNHLFDYAVHNLAVTIDETGSVVTKDELPTVIGDDRRLRQLFQNLIGNAVKYRDPEKMNHVHVSAKEITGGWQFCVEDNGIGIAKEYYEKIFVIFKRLHTRQEYDGTGIGLSLCKRIVEAHNGKIWVESESGKGSRFYFTLMSNM